MIIYFDIDNPVIMGGAYFEVSFFSMPGNVLVGSIVNIADNLQHSIDLPAGDYRMNIIYYDGVSEIGCSGRDIFFTVPDDVIAPCVCGSVSAEIVDNCDGSYHFLVSASDADNCGYTTTYSRDIDAIPPQTINMVGTEMIIPISGPIGHSYVRIDTTCCDGSTITCLLLENLTPNTCGGCPMPVISFNNAVWVEYDGVQYMQISFNVEDGALPIHVHARQLNQLTGPNNVPVIMHLEPITSYQNSLIFNLQAQPLSIGTTDYNIRVSADNACIKDPNSTGNISDTMINFTMPPP